MAVVQISKIQVRRGQKNQGSGLPQLASGEIGWAIDTRELFIGNGAVSEGAPAVGNTKVLTEYDDLFSLADTYTYRADDSYILTGPNSTNSVKRTLQQRLDDRVSVRAYDVRGDGTQICTEQLQRAIDQLYINDANKANPQSRVILHLEPGLYKIDGTIYLPPYATLVGAGSDKTIIETSVATAIFRTVNSSSTPGTPADDSSSTTLTQASNIRLEGMTLKNTTDGKALVLQSCKESFFKDIKFIGSWTSDSPIAKTSAALELNSLSGTVETANNNFENCVFENYSYGIISNWDIDQNSFSHCEFDTLGYGVVFGEDMIIGSASSGQSIGPSYNHFESCNFKNINRNAIWIVNGQFNTSTRSSYKLVGNNGGLETSPAYPILKFEKDTNKSFEDSFTRTSALISGSGLASIPYVPEIEGTAFYNIVYEKAITFGQVSGVRLFRLPGVINQGYKIHYTMVSNNYIASRSGTLHIVTNSYNDTAEISDEFQFVGDDSYLDSIEFSIVLRDVDGDLTKDTIDVNVTSTMPVDDQTQFKFTIEAKKTDIN